MSASYTKTITNLTKEEKRKKKCQCGFLHVSVYSQPYLCDLTDINVTDIVAV